MVIFDTKTSLLEKKNNCPLSESAPGHHPGLNRTYLAYLWLEPDLSSTPILCEKVTWGGKKTPRTFAWPFFCYRFFFLPYRFTGDCDYSNKYNRFSIANNILHDITAQLNYSNIISRGRRQQSRRRQRCSRRQRQRQLRGSEVPRAGLGEEDFFAKTLSFRISFCYRFGLRFSYVFLYCWSFDAV